MTNQRYLKYASTEKGRIARNHAYRNYCRRQREKLFVFLGNSCAKCGFEDARALQIDHIKGDGHEDRAIGIMKRINYYLRHPEEAKLALQILCANCNWIKRHEETADG